MKRNFWKKDDVQVLLECVKNNQTLVATFKEAATKLGRSEAACKYEYYKLKQDKDIKKSNLWTPEEDKILSEQIEICDTRREAFEKTSELTGRTVASCTQRWYDHLSMEKKTFFATVSKKSSVKNRTRPSRKVPATPRDETWWKKILKLLGI